MNYLDDVDIGVAKSFIFYINFILNQCIIFCSYFLDFPNLDLLYPIYSDRISCTDLIILHHCNYNHKSYKTNCLKITLNFSKA